MLTLLALSNTRLNSSSHPNYTPVPIASSFQNNEFTSCNSSYPPAGPISSPASSLHANIACSHESFQLCSLADKQQPNQFLHLLKIIPKSLNLGHSQPESLKQLRNQKNNKNGSFKVKVRMACPTYLSYPPKSPPILPLKPPPPRPKQSILLNYRTPFTYSWPLLPYLGVQC